MSLGYALRHSAAGFDESEGAYRAHEDLFLRKYRHWRGRSGRSYAFSVYASAECPAYVDAVVIVAERRGGRVLALVDLGPFAESRLLKLRRRFAERLEEIEFHVHVLAEREGDRRALMTDLDPLAA